jgi:predicted Zn-dependent peptidase
MKNLSVRMILLLISFFILAHGPLGNNLTAGSNGFKLPEYKKFVLKNGLTVYLMEQHEVPLIYVSAVFPAGATKDNGKFGVASLTADALLFGTKNYTKDQIEETLDFLGVSYETSAAREFASVSMSFMKTDQSKVFPILKEIIVHPIFDKDEFDKRKKQLLVELEQAKEQPARVIGEYFNKFLFENHAYGNPISGSISSVSALRIEDVKNFYASYYLPAESAISFVGDFKTSELKKEIEKLFADWKGTRTSLATKEIAVPAHPNNRLLLVNKDDATETQFVIGSFGIKRSNPDYIAIQVVNTILGGRFTSWLNDELRVNKGLTYGARSNFLPYKDSGIFIMSSYTRTEKTIEAIDLAVEVYNRLHEQGIDETTLASARNYIKGQYPPRYETAGSLASLLTSMFVYEFDESFINNFQKNVEEMTVEKSKQIIQNYFPKENLQFVLIGKASEIKDQVKKYGELFEKEIKADGF